MSFDWELTFFPETTFIPIFQIALLSNLKIFLGYFALGLGVASSSLHPNLRVSIFFSVFIEFVFFFGKIDLSDFVYLLKVCRLSCQITVFFLVL